MDILAENINTMNGGVIFGQLILGLVIGIATAVILRSIDTTIQMFAAIFFGSIASAVPAIIPGVEGNLAIPFFLGISGIGIFALFTFLNRS